MDEDTLTIPAPWRRRLHPRRGGTPGPATAIDPAAATTLRRRLDDQARDVQDVIGHPRSDPRLATAARRYLDGHDDPLGATVTGLIAVRRDRDQPDSLAGLVDAWCARHGAAFTAAAVAGLGHAEATWEWIEPGRVSEAWLRPRDPGEPYGPWWAIRDTLRRTRAVLAAADDTEYRRAADLLGEYREDPLTRLLAAYLMPTRQDWVDECVTEALDGVQPGRSWMLWCCVQTPDQAVALSDADRVPTDAAVATTAVEAVGAAMAPLLARAYDAAHRAEARRVSAELLAILPTDEAFQALLDRTGKDGAANGKAANGKAGRSGKDRVRPALAAAMRRFPDRAARLLGDAASGTGPTATIAAELLKDHRAVHATPPSPSAPKAIPAAAPRDVPASLIDPPWSSDTRPPGPVIDGLVAPDGDAVRWADGERELWRGRPYPPPDREWDQQIAAHQTGRLSSWETVELFRDGPLEQVRPLFAAWAATDPGCGFALQPLAARYELDAVPMIADAAATAPAEFGETLLPFLTERVAALMADWAVRLKTARPIAHDWFARHRIGAAVQLVPTALGPHCRARSAAEFALLHIADNEGDAAVVGAAHIYGADAAAAVTKLLEPGADRLPPVRVPTIGAWADPALLPRVLLEGRDRALPADAVHTLLTTLALPLPGGARPDVSDVVRACDAESLAAFSWDVFQRWDAAGHPAKDGWALTQLGLLGGDPAARRLTPLIKAWPGHGRHANAATGLDVLTEIGTDLALTHLHAISRTRRYPALRRRARAAIRQVADDLGLTRDELADRLVPDFGLDAHGTLVLDYGPRRFTAGFDELLRPVVRDQHGKPRKTLPKPGAADDPALAPAAYRRFAALRTDVRTVATDQLGRLESAMTERRTWSAADFRRYLAAHPLMRHLARRLVWATGDDTTFRVAEDGTFADSNDDVYDLPDTARVRIVHPLDPPGALTPWAPVFADYEIAQPFPQLERPVDALTADEHRTENLDRHEGATVPLGRLLGLERRGWEPEHVGDAGIVGGMTRGLPGGAAAHIAFDPGVPIGHRDAAERITVSVWIQGTEILGPVGVSELLTELAAALTP
ncbi:hypothetical protein GCM10022254_11370 [Actinomadura meridiana]|uniref:DUF4132 domain-containing protein n=1 Tax=Actinomadura meridiana TaxID=559626 RepID=A0ABP8BU78_9ACTN